MQELKVIRTEEDRLVVATDSGDTFALAIDEVLRAELRRAKAVEASAHGRSARPSPREIQAHIRSGLSAEETAELLGASVEDITRFEAPVLAEREHMVGLALAVPVLLGAVDEADARPTFGAAIRAKLTDAGASGERWTSWKESTGWIVKLAFQVGEIDHDARWSFDPRRSALAPLNSDATQLSRQGSLPEGLIPRLRALDSSPTLKDDTRFDSGAFGPRHLERPAESEPTAESQPAAAAAPAATAVTDAAIKRAPETSVTSVETADLLDALRRRRGQREPAPGLDTPAAPTRSHAPVALFDALEPGYQETVPTLEIEVPGEQASTTGDHAARRRGRSALPSWDEIVFGARGEAE